MLRKVFKFSQNPVITAVTAGHIGMLLLHGGFLEVNITSLIRVLKGKVMLTVGALRRLSASQRGHCCKKGSQFAQKRKGFLRLFVKTKMGRPHLFVTSSVVTVFHMLDFLIMYETLYPALLGLICLLKSCV